MYILILILKGIAAFGIGYYSRKLWDKSKSAAIIFWIGGLFILIYIL